MGFDNPRQKLPCNFRSTSAKRHNIIHFTPWPWKRAQDFLCSANWLLAFSRNNHQCFCGSHGHRKGSKRSDMKIMNFSTRSFACYELPSWPFSHHLAMRSFSHKKGPFTILSQYFSFVERWRDNEALPKHRTLPDSLNCASEIIIELKTCRISQIIKRIITKIAIFSAVNKIVSFRWMCPVWCPSSSRYLHHHLPSSSNL